MTEVSSRDVPAGDLEPGFPAAPCWMLARELAGLDERALLGLAGSLPPGGERRAAVYELLVSRYDRLVRSCVRRYLHTPELVEDLMQVGYVGLLKAIGNFDPAICGSLAAYARPCINGELRRHFRDKRWQVHVTRSVKDLMLESRVATGQLAQELGRTPTESDVARYLGVSADQLRHARGAELALQPSSLDAPLGGQPGAGTPADCLGELDLRIEHVLDMNSVAAHWGELPLREQKILLMDFYGGLTQAEIGRRLGISQMHVSRLRARALSYLRSRLVDLEEQGNGASATALLRNAGGGAALRSGGRAGAHRAVGAEPAGTAAGT